MTERTFTAAEIENMAGILTLTADCVFQNPCSSCEEKRRLAAMLRQAAAALAALTAAAEREAALLKRINTLNINADEDARSNEALQNSLHAAEAALAEAQREIARLRAEVEYNKMGWVNCGSIVNRAESALAAVTRERDTAEDSIRQMQDRLQRLIDGAAAERQKVAALREWLEKRRDSGWSDHNEVETCRDALTIMDSLGLTADAPQPAGEKP